MSEYAILHQHSDQSLLDSVCKVKDIINKAKEFGMESCAITDHGSLGNCISFFKEAKKAGIKPILGQEFYVAVSEKKNLHMVVLSKNLKGWKNMLKATSRANLPDRFFRKPRLFLDDFADYSDGLLAISGHCGSLLFNAIFDESVNIYNCETETQVHKHINPNYKEDLTKLIWKHVDIFGKDNFFIEIQLIDQETLPAAKVAGQILREIGKELDVPRVCSSDAHYISREVACDQRVLLCVNLNTTLQEIERKINNDEEFGLGGFFRSNNYHIPSPAEMRKIHTEDELKNSILIRDMCEFYNVLSKPMIPKFDCPDDLSADEYMTHLCREGWKKKIKGVIPKDKESEYADRVKMELSVLQGAGLSPYFLIVQDYVNWARSQGQLVGVSRGSVGGCLTGYLMGIHSLDSIKYDLIFERFYNAGRNTADRVSLADIDCDFPVEFRPQVINYLKEKYGKTHVSQMATFGRMMGRSVIKDVLRAHSACSYEEMNRITEYIPDEAAISDQLNDMKEAGEEPSIILWALQHNAKELSEWCQIDDDGKLIGQYAHYFAQAMRLEGTKRSQGKHAAGVVISPVPLDEVCPMLYDKHTGESVAGFDMGSLEDLGLLKVDILGLAALDKIQSVTNLLAIGE